MFRLKRIIFCLGLILVPIHCYAEGSISAKSAVGQYTDDTLSAKSASVGLTTDVVIGEKPEFGTSLSVNSEIQEVTKGNSEEAKSVELDGGDKLISKTLGLDVTQSLGFDHTIRLFGSAGKVGEHKNQSFGIGGQKWIIPDKFRLGLSTRRNLADQAVSDFTDIDGKRVITPDHIEGQNGQLDVMAYLSPTTIGLFNYSYTTRTDRPAAWSGSAQVREYVTAADASIHLTLSHYENVGTIQPITTYGTIVSNAVAGEWHQKVGIRTIIMGGYRFYAEKENPRSDTVDAKTVGSDYLYTTIRIRQQKSWTYRSSEISLSAGRYLNNAGRNGTLVAAGIDWIVP